MTRTPVFVWWLGFNRCLDDKFKGNDLHTGVDRLLVESQTEVMAGVRAGEQELQDRWRVNEQVRAAVSSRPSSGRYPLCHIPDLTTCSKSPVWVLR